MYEPKEKFIEEAEQDKKRDETVFVLSLHIDFFKRG